MNAHSLSALLLATTISLTGHGLLAQDLGRGNLGPQGREPQLRIEAALPGQMLRMRVRDLPRGASATLRCFFLLSTGSARIPLGKSGAILGVDPAALFLAGPLPVTNLGQAELALRIDPAWTGLALYVQAFGVDLRAADKRIFTDSKSLVLGRRSPEIVLAQDAGRTGLLNLVRRSFSGKPGLPLPFCRDLVLSSISLTAAAESRRYREDRARLVMLDHSSPGGLEALRLVDGSTIVHFRRAGETGFLRIYANGRVDLLAQGKNFEARILASHDYLAFVTESKQLFLYRVDGSNWPGSAEPLHAVALPKQLDFDESSLVFGKKVLLLVDEHAGPVFVPLDGSALIFPKFPFSAGAAPKTFDEEIAVSGDGHSFALGAGKDEDWKDIYVLRDDARVINVSKRPTLYASVGYANPGRRVELALNHDGSLVSWVDRTVKDDANYVSKVDFPAPRLITGAPVFKCIDIGTTSRFPPKGGILIVAGQSVVGLDLFFSASMSKNDVIPLTKTGSALVAPFAADSKLALLDLATVSAADPYLLWARHQKGYRGLWHIDPGRRAAHLLSKAHTGQGLKLHNQRLVLTDDGAGLLVFDPAADAKTPAQRIALGTRGQVLALAQDRLGRFAFASVGSMGAERVYRIPSGSWKPTALTKTARGSAEILPGMQAGQLFMLSAPHAVHGRSLLVSSMSSALKDLGGRALRFFVQRP